MLGRHSERTRKNVGTRGDILLVRGVGTNRQCRGQKTVAFDVGSSTRAIVPEEGNCGNAEEECIGSRAETEPWDTFGSVSMLCQVTGESWLRPALETGVVVDPTGIRVWGEGRVQQSWAPG